MEKCGLHVRGESTCCAGGIPLIETCFPDIYVGSVDLAVRTVRNQSRACEENEESRAYGEDRERIAMEFGESV
jgi:hypothetical protein